MIKTSTDIEDKVNSIIPYRKVGKILCIFAAKVLSDRKLRRAYHRLNRFSRYLTSWRSWRLVERERGMKFVLAQLLTWRHCCDVFLAPLVTSDNKRGENNIMRHKWRYLFRCYRRDIKVECETQMSKSSRKTEGDKFMKVNGKYDWEIFIFKITKIKCPIKTGNLPVIRIYHFNNMKKPTNSKFLCKINSNNQLTLWQKNSFLW